jgi:hypothetical protein
MKVRGLVEWNSDYTADLGRGPTCVRLAAHRCTVVAALKPLGWNDPMATGPA